MIDKVISSLLAYFLEDLIVEVEMVTRRLIQGVPSILPTAVGVIGSVDVTPTEMRDNVVFFIL